MGSQPGLNWGGLAVGLIIPGALPGAICGVVAGIGFGSVIAGCLLGFVAASITSVVVYEPKPRPRRSVGPTPKGMIKGAADREAHYRRWGLDD